MRTLKCHWNNLWPFEDVSANEVLGPGHPQKEIRIEFSQSCRGPRRVCCFDLRKWLPESIEFLRLEGGERDVDDFRPPTYNKRLLLDQPSPLNPKLTNILVPLRWQALYKGDCHGSSIGVDLVFFDDSLKIDVDTWVVSCRNDPLFRELRAFNGGRSMHHQCDR